MGRRGDCEWYMERASVHGLGLLEEVTGYCLVTKTTGTDAEHLRMETLLLWKRSLDPAPVPQAEVGTLISLPLTGRLADWTHLEGPLEGP